jgi:hypothetical protein
MDGGGWVAEGSSWHERSEFLLVLRHIEQTYRPQGRSVSIVITRLRAVWNGWSGAPGYTSIYLLGSPTATGLDSAAAAFKQFFTSLALQLPSAVTVSFDSTVNRIDEKTGIVTSVDGITTPPTSVSMSGGTQWGAPAGCVVLWRTGTVAKRRLTVGRTFLVPLSANTFQSDGTIVDSNRTAITTAGTTLVNTLAGLTPGHMIVWRRPSAKGASDGLAVDVTAASVTDKVQILRSRRGR